jgi:hypothetical protein
MTAVKKQWLAEVPGANDIKQLSYKEIPISEM